MRKRYIEAETFEDFKINQDKMINILNHNITSIKKDLSWIKYLIMTETTAIVTFFIKEILLR